MNARIIPTSNINLFPARFCAYALDTHATPGTARGLGPDTLVPSTLTYSGVTATAAFAAAHRMVTGMRVTVAGADLAPYNGLFVITVTSTTEFTYTMLSTPTGNANVAAVEMTFQPQAQWALVLAASDNTNAITLGPDANADLYSLSQGDTFLMPVPVGHKIDLGDWYIKSDAASMSLKVLFL